MTKKQAAKKANTFVQAIASRIEAEKTKATMSASNMKKLERAKELFERDSYFELLTSVEADASIAQQNVYAIDKFIDLLQNTLNYSKMNTMNKHIFLTAMKCAIAKEHMFVSDAKAACSKDIKVDAKRAKYVVQRSEATSASTVNAQSQSTLAAMRALQILKSVANENVKQAFEVQTENAIYKSLSENMQSAIA